jgi:Cytochrome P460
MVRLIFSFLMISSISVAEDSSKNWGGLDVMNDIKMKDYPDFEKKWRLVTVRYRKDSKELRFTYANAKAWKTLSEGKIDYSEGAVFAKIGFITGEDSAFPNSMVPSGAKRYQFMVKNAKKYKDTDGWGYALFQDQGQTYPEDPKLKTQACHACHKIVPERGFVFSEPVYLSPFINYYKKTGKNYSDRLEYVTKEIKDLPAHLQAALPKGTQKVRWLTGALQKNMFEGTLNEIRPLLALEVQKSGMPAVLVSDSGQLYSMVFRNTESTHCQTSEALTDMSTVFSKITVNPLKPSELLNENTPVRIDFCW